MAAAIARRSLSVNAVARPSGQRAARVVPRAAINDSGARMFRESGADAGAAAAGAPAAVATPFDNYAFAPIREATVRAAPCSAPRRVQRLSQPRAWHLPPRTRPHPCALPPSARKTAAPWHPPSRCRAP
jgi:hypothetical protein